MLNLGALASIMIREEGYLKPYFTLIQMSYLWRNIEIWGKRKPFSTKQKAKLTVKDIPNLMEWSFLSTMHGYCWKWMTCSDLQKLIRGASDVRFWRWKMGSKVLPILNTMTRSNHENNEEVFDMHSKGIRSYCKLLQSSNKNKVSALNQ